MAGRSPNGGSELLEATEPGSSAPAREARGAAQHATLPRWALFAAIVAVVVVVDQLTKAWIVGRLAPGEAFEVFGPNLRIVYTQNSGALFGMFRDQAALFALASLGVIAVILAYQAYAGGSLLTTLALSLLLGGAIGNLIDRVRFGFVVDFVDAGIGSLRWYTFNVADAAISGSIVLLIVLAILPAERGRAPGEMPPDPSSGAGSAGDDAAGR